VPQNEKRLTELLAKLVDTGSLTAYPAELGVIFHSTGLHTCGKFFAFVRKGELVIKLPAPRVAELITLQAGRPFDAGRQRPLKEWIVLGPMSPVSARALVVEAAAFVASQLQKKRE
jgi:hypothetical protein